MSKIDKTDIEVIRLVAALQCIHAAIAAAHCEVNRVRAGWNAALMAGVTDIGLLRRDSALVEEMRGMLLDLERRKGAEP